MNAESAPQLVSIVVPVYDSTRSVKELADRLQATFSALDGFSWELILVDDASPSPETWPLLEALARDTPEVRAFQLTRNFGQHAATLCGLAEARGAWVVTMDDDLQHRPEDIPALLAERRHDIVIGAFTRRRHSLFKRATSWLKAIFDRLVIGKPRSVRLSAFRLINRVVVDGMLKIQTPHPFIPALMLHISKDIVNVETGHDPRKHGRSGYSLLKLVSLFSRLLINNSSLLLQGTAYIGVLGALGSFVMAGVFTYRKLVFGSKITGWASLMVTSLFFFGVILFSLGVVGEYLSRLVAGVERKPTYFVRRRVEE